VRSQRVKNSAEIESAGESRENVASVVNLHEKESNLGELLTELRMRVHMVALAEHIGYQIRREYRGVNDSRPSFVVRTPGFGATDPDVNAVLEIEILLAEAKGAAEERIKELLAVPVSSGPSMSPFGVSELLPLDAEVVSAEAGKKSSRRKRGKKHEA
jgi:hypothetical protein